MVDKFLIFNSMNIYICFLVFDFVSIIIECSRSAKNSFYRKFHDIHDIHDILVSNVNKLVNLKLDCPRDRLCSIS
jgi:hypothetical protein